MLQKTISKEISITGIGQHKGTENTITLKPADINTGITFIIKGKVFPFTIENVYGEAGYTTIGDLEKENVKTIEHLISAIHGLGIDNIIIETQSEEIPITDGSSIPLIKEIEKAGIIEQNAKKKFIKILKPIQYSDNTGDVSFSPSQNNFLTLDITIDYTVIIPIGIQSIKLDLTEDNYKTLIATARTFARLSDVEYLHSKGLCLGATLKSGVAVDEEKVINEEGLRFPDEFVRHKVLDAIGDLYLLGHQIIGYYKSFKGGHFHNNKLVKKILSDKSNYEIVEL